MDDALDFIKDSEPREAIGGNNPPDPLDIALAPYGDYITEAESWLDGEPVKDEAQMKAVDALLKQIKAAKKDVTEAEKSVCLPLHDAWKAGKAKFKPTLDDLDRMSKGLVSLVGGFKKQIAREQEEARRKAEAEARRKREEAEAKAREAAAGDIEAQRAADAAIAEAKQATKEAKQTEVTKGLRTVTKYAIDDHRALLHWIAANDRDAITAFIEEHARRNYKANFAAGIIPAGMRIWTDREAF